MRGGRTTKPKQSHPWRTDKLTVEGKKDVIYGYIGEKIIDMERYKIQNQMKKMQRKRFPGKVDTR